MSATTRKLCCWVFLCLIASVALAQAPPEPIVATANSNRIPAGSMENGIVNVQLQIVDSVWHAEAEDGPPLFVQAFREVGKPAQIPGPLLRVPANTTVHVTVTNRLNRPATVHGFLTRPATADPGLTIAPNKTEEITFASGSPGTYFYWAQTTESVHRFGVDLRPPFEDAELNGAFIVDPPGPLPPDRIYVLHTMFGRPNALTPGFEVASINGKEYPYNDAPEYTMGDTVRWRIINPSFSEHPMHLHGAFYKVLSMGTDTADTAYAPAEQQSVVTQNLRPGHTMLMEWTPANPGRWMFHCHFHAHMSSDERVPVVALQRPNLYGPPERVVGAALPHDPPGSSHGMAGLMLMINVKAKPGTLPEQVAHNPRKLQLVLQPDSSEGKAKLLSCSLREGSKVAASHGLSVGPPMVLTRDEPVEITVVNHMTEPATIHWHGLELESYYDGVMGAGMGEKTTPMIEPGSSFVVRFTPNRAGTFIYHTHASNPEQLSQGVYGGLIVLAPGQKYDDEHERLLVIGTRDTFFTAEHITVNGSETLTPVPMKRGVTYRVRVVNMAPNLPGTIVIGTNDHPLEWLPVAKDGADLPARLHKPATAKLDIDSGETYDFEFQPQGAGEIPITVINRVNGAKLEGKILVEDGTAVAKKD